MHSRVSGQMDNVAMHCGELHIVFNDSFTRVFFGVFATFVFQFCPYKQDVFFLHPRIVCYPLNRGGGQKCTVLKCLTPSVSQKCGNSLLPHANH